jgi:hypothetical protein
MASMSLAPPLTGLSRRELECVLSRLPISRRGRPGPGRSGSGSSSCAPRSARTSPSASSARCFARPGRKYIESCATSFHGWRRCCASESTGVGLGPWTGRSSPPGTTPPQLDRRTTAGPATPRSWSGDTTYASSPCAPVGPATATSDSLPRLDHPVPVPRARPRTRRWRLPRTPRTRHSCVRAEPHRAGLEVAPPSKATCTCRARLGKAKGLEGATGSSPPCRFLAQTLAAVAFLHNLRIRMRQELRDTS